MKYTQALDRLVEIQTEWVHDALYGTAPHHVECPMCHEMFPDADERWRYPHECAKGMPEKDAFVCSEECAADWKEWHWDEIEEYNNKTEKVESWEK